jgi:hypothetical protein
MMCARGQRGLCLLGFFVKRPLLEKLALVNEVARIAGERTAVSGPRPPLLSARMRLRYWVVQYLAYIIIYYL